MEWIETDEDPADDEAWESLFEDIASSISWLDEQFSGSDTRDVFDAVRCLVGETAAVHERAGVLHLVWPSVIDVAAEADLVERWTAVEVDSDDDQDDVGLVKRRMVSTALRCVVDGARRACGEADDAACRVAGQVEESGTPSLAALRQMSIAVQRLVEWATIYVEAAVGSYEVTGLLPSNCVGGGTLIEVEEYQQVQDLRAELAALA